jgi:hypothetical protein
MDILTSVHEIEVSVRKMERVTEENGKNEKGRGGENEKMGKGKKTDDTKKEEKPREKNGGLHLCYMNKLLKSST